MRERDRDCDIASLREREREREREFFIDNLLVRIHYIILMIKWTGLASLRKRYLDWCVSSSERP